MSRYRKPRWLALLAAAVLSAGTLVTGVLIGPAQPARAASLGTVALSQQNGAVSDTPMFTTATSSAPCPSGFGENAGLRVGRPGGPYSNLTRALGGGGYDTAPVEFTADRSFATALGGTAPEPGAWLVIIECFSLTQGRHLDEFQTRITVCADTWWVGQTCGTAAPTTTTITVAPEGEIPQGAPVTLTAAVEPATAAGEVVFTRTTGPETAELGTAQVGSGTATLALPKLPDPPGSDANAEVTHVLRASFRPSDADAFQASTSEPVNAVVVRGDPPSGTTTTLTVAPESPAASGSVLVFTATVTAAEGTPTGAVRFERKPATGTEWTVIATANLTNGTAIHSADGAAKVPDGTYTVQAVYTPSDETEFASSTGTVNDYVVGEEASEPTATTVTLGVAPASPTEAGTELTLTATVTPAAAAGTVRFLDGTTELGTLTVAGGTAVYRTTALAEGTHSLKAAFTPADATAYGPSESTVASHEVTAPDDGGDDGGDDNGDGGGGGSLASTGTPLVTIGATGLLLVGAGAATMLATRRRRPAPEPVDWPDARG